MRPLVKNKERDTAQNALNSMKKMEGDIKNVRYTVIICRKGKKINIKHLIAHSMHDGKQRKAWAEELVKMSSKEGMKLKQHGCKSKLDNRTCMFCLGNPNTYNSRTSLKKKPVLLEDMKRFGISCMHMKIRLMELVFNAAVKKRVTKMKCSEKVAKQYFQEQFLSEKGGGLRIFIPEPSGGELSRYLTQHLKLTL